MEEEKKERIPANLKTELKNITIDDLQKVRITEKYQVRRQLSAGTFGRVFQILRKSDKKLLAAKCIPRYSIEENSAIMKPYVEREISLLTSFNHNYTMQLEDGIFISEANDILPDEQLVIISELAEGNLQDYIKNYPGFVPEEKILKIFTQILLGVNFLHRNEIDHRDLKPMNILLYDKSERAKLADFGVARKINSLSTKMT